MGSQGPATKPSSHSRTTTTTSTTLHSRRTHCTHSSFTREFSSYDRFATCQMCKRGPDLGWVYACTEDEDRLDARDGYPPQENHQPSATAISTSLKAGDVVQLNDWIENAIKNGHYTPEQVELIRSQRAAVLETLNTDNRVMRDPINPETRSCSSTEDPEHSESATANSYVKVPFSILLPACHSALGHITIPACRLRVCPGCMPTATERSWQCLDRICRDDYMTNDRLLEILAAIAIRIDAASMARESRKVPTPDGSSSFDISDEQVGGDGCPADANNAMCDAGAVENSDNDTRGADVEKDEITPPDVVDSNFINKAPRQKKSLRELLRLHRNHAKRATGGRMKNHHRHEPPHHHHGQQELCISSIDSPSDTGGDDWGRRTGMELQKQHRRVSENTRPQPQQARTARPEFLRRAKYDSSVRHHVNGGIADNTGADMSELGFVPIIDRLTDPADREEDMIIARV
ncbi:uncharacterized protein BDCG_05009 [Blastomyces dermatitidis ER-3]|uniref:RING finger domain-containing protein n=1 Tax=Ajellomyces dermatitidis (strain ER-3 / ATCC MYA-2586) TaxID=559297 RepID=A0ABP2F221_AJEDR|nr:uncharacterized protein BDCG_05009 [Blastomyces dermatitidis ER-3]EEQ89889.1 hypothetical protein BDCG_05009 [Blastomyces dermatitidis ER-3]